MRVLLIDDDPLMLDALAEVLQPRFEVVIAEGGEIGLARFCQAILDGRPFHAVVTDLGMPARDGIECIRRIRKIDPDMHAILLTSREMLEALSEISGHR